MTIWDFLDRHWGFWLALFVLIVILNVLRTVRSALILAATAVQAVAWRAIARDREAQAHDIQRRP
jgi:hypothetical protein